MNDTAVSRDDIHELRSFQVDWLTAFRAEQRDDRDVRREVQRALTLDRLVPLSVVAQVQDGVVTLKGAVSRYAERDDALILASGVPGVLGIMDELVLSLPPRLGVADVGAGADADAT